MYWNNRYTYICIQCRFTSKYGGRCPTCSGDLRGMYNFQPPRKRDERDWRKVELSVKVRESGLDLCSCWECVPARRKPVKLSLSEYRASIRKRLRHHQGEVPRYSRYA